MCFLISGFLELRQTHRTVTDYLIEFRTLAAFCWNAEAQWDMFLHRLAPHIQDEIYALDLPTSLDGLIDLLSGWTPGYGGEVSTDLFSQLLIVWTGLHTTHMRRLTKSRIPSPCKWDNPVSLRMRGRDAVTADYVYIAGRRAIGWYSVQ